MSTLALTSELVSFLRNDENTRSREYLVNHHLFYELKLAAAKCGYALKLYIPDVDREGFDIILDDGDTTRHMQLKTVLSDSSTSTWSVHKRLIRPSYLFCQQLGFGLSPFGVGIEGGVILIQLSVNNESVLFDFFYTDIFVITALFLRIANPPRRIMESTFKNFYKQVKDGISHEQFGIPKSLFVKCKGPEHLLALMGLHSRYDHTWRHHLPSVSQVEMYGLEDETNLPGPKNILINEISTKLFELTNDLSQNNS